MSDEKIFEKKIPDPPSPSDSKFKRVTRNLNKTIESVQGELMNENQIQKCELNFLLDELKSGVQLGRNTLMESNGENSDHVNLENKISEARQLTIKLTKMIDTINNKEVLRKQLPSPEWSVWDSSPENYLDFKAQMETHLQALGSEKLKLSTLKSKIVGRESENIKKELLGVQTLTEAFRVLDKKHCKFKEIYLKYCQAQTTIFLHWPTNRSGN